MKTSLMKVVFAILLSVSVRIACADVSGIWVFSVTLSEFGSGDATITLNQEDDSKLTGTYAGQLTNGPIEGTYEGDKFEFSFDSPALGASITYSGELNADGTVTGNVLMQGQNIGSFNGKKR